VLSAAAVVLWTVGALAQAKPSFTGSWTPDAEKNPAPAAGGGGGGRGGGARPMTIKQDMATFTIERQGQNGPTSLTYKLDGSTMEVTTGRGQAKATAKWDGNNIVVEQVTETAGTTKNVYSIEGAWLVQTTTAPGRAGGEPTTTKTYYKKG
jgi:hypothetical protein